MPSFLPSLPRFGNFSNVAGGVNISNRRFVVDPTIGSVVAFCTFGAGNPNGGSGSPDTIARTEVAISFSVTLTPPATLLRRWNCSSGRPSPNEEPTSVRPPVPRSP